VREAQNKVGRFTAECQNLSTGRPSNRPVQSPSLSVKLKSQRMLASPLSVKSQKVGQLMTDHYWHRHSPLNLREWVSRVGVCTPVDRAVDRPDDSACIWLPWLQFSFLSNMS